MAGNAKWEGNELLASLGWRHCVEIGQIDLRCYARLDGHRRVPGLLRVAYVRLDAEGAEPISSRLNASESRAAEIVGDGLREMIFRLSQVEREALDFRFARADFVLPVVTRVDGIEANVHAVFGLGIRDEILVNRGLVVVHGALVLFRILCPVAFFVLWRREAADFISGIAAEIGVAEFGNAKNFVRSQAVDEIIAGNSYGVMLRHPGLQF